MQHINSMVVFCGGSAGRRAEYEREARRMGQILAENDIKLIYGAGGTGLMRALAEGAFEKGGFVIGATIRALYEIEKPMLAGTKIDKFEVWDKMAERKISMTRQADAVCILPGGFGTMDEFFELLTLRQLGISQFPIVVVNVAGFFDPLKFFIEKMRVEGFIKPHQMKLLSFVESVEEVLPAIEEQFFEGREKK